MIYAILLCCLCVTSGCAQLPSPIKSLFAYTDTPIYITSFSFRQWTSSDILSDSNSSHILVTYANDGRTNSFNHVPPPEFIADGSFLTNGFTIGQISISFSAEPDDSYYVQWKPTMNPSIAITNSQGTIIGWNEAAWVRISPALTNTTTFQSGIISHNGFFRIIKTDP